MVHVMVLQVTQLENLTEQVEHQRCSESCIISEMSGAILQWTQNRLVVAAHLVGSSSQWQSIALSSECLLFDCFCSCMLLGN